MFGRYVLALACVACGGGGRGVPTPSGDPAPRLVVLVVIDQLPQWAFAAKRPALTHGFDRLLREGEWHVGRYSHGATLTAPGHAMIGTGATPSQAGIIANEWWDRTEERRVRSVEDGSGVSAHYLRVPGLGDAVARAGTGAKAVSISLKDRAALLPLGHEGMAVWYNRKKSTWSTSVPRPWLDELRRTHPIAPRLATPWVPLDAAALPALTGTIDAQPGEVGEKGFDATFPHDPTTTHDVSDAVFAMPLGNTLVLEAALAAIDGEGLGADAVPDLLIISFSAHDFVGHGWGLESWESWDLVLRLDRELDTFLAAVDQRVGPGGWALALTSDHGGSPLPERVGGGRILYEDIEEAANAVATRLLGPGQWVVVMKAPYLFLTKAARAVPPAIRGELLRLLREEVRTMRGVERAELTSDVGGDCEQRTAEARELCLMIDLERAGEIVFLPQRGWILQRNSQPQATAHGSLHDYDREVPILLLPPGRRAHASLTAASGPMLSMDQISTIVARWLGVTPPLELPPVPTTAPAGAAPSDDDPY